MTVLWLIVWLINGTPNLHFGHNWNSWAISLVICAGLDILGGREAL